MSIDRQGRSYTPRISLRPLLPWLLLASALSITMMVLGAGRGDQFLPSIAAGLLVALVVGTGLGINAPLWSKATGVAARNDGQSSIREALRCNVWLAALVYAWGASALFAVYSLSDLTWRHSFQYGTGAAVFAAGLGIYGLRLGSNNNNSMPPLHLTAIHGLAALGGLIYLLGTDKLENAKGDWAANEVFLWGGFAIVALCLMSIVTQTRSTGS
jgi:peptidoglycan/LPS O-acetylase OafA/YrhL